MIFNVATYDKDKAEVEEWLEGFQAWLVKFKPRPETEEK